MISSDELSSGYVRVEPTRLSQSNLLEKKLEGEVILYDMLGWI